MLKNLFIAVVVLSLVFFSQNCLADLQSENSESDSNLIGFLVIVYIVLIIGLICYFYEGRYTPNRKYQPLVIEHEKKHEPIERFYSRIVEEEEIKYPVLYECKECKRQFVSIAPREKVKCPWCKIKEQTR